MANIAIKHSKIKFEKMDKNSMYVNAAAAEKNRKKIDSNYKQIENAWSEIEKSFTKLAGKSSGKVQELFTEATTAARKKKSGVKKRREELDNKLNNDVQDYASTLLRTETMKTLISRLTGY